MLELDEKYFETTKTATSTSATNSTANNHVTSSPCAKRKRVEPSSLSEEDQIKLAIGTFKKKKQKIVNFASGFKFECDFNASHFFQLAHSLKEVSSAEDGNKSDSFEEPSSDESEFDFDDDTSNQSFVKSQTSQTVSEKSNTFDNKMGANDAAAAAAASAANIVTTTSSSTTTETFAEDADNDESECDSKSAGEPCVSTVETYDNYLGDESGKFGRRRVHSDWNPLHIQS